MKPSADVTSIMSTQIFSLSNRFASFFDIRLCIDYSVLTTDYIGSSRATLAMSVLQTTIGRNVSWVHTRRNASTAVMCTAKAFSRLVDGINSTYGFAARGRRTPHSVDGSCVTSSEENKTAFRS